MAQGDPKKFQMPGWKIEQHYSPGVLIGNWAEERYKFTKGNFKHLNTHRIDFINYGNHRPDVLIRRKGELKMEGLPARLFLHHHGTRYANNMVSWYDEHYNGRYREKNLPEKRTWNFQDLSWKPERNDFLVEAPPTNFGLLGEKQKKWAHQIQDECAGDYLSTYTVSYQNVPPEAIVRTRYATPKMDSTPLHPVNKVLKNLHLRNAKLIKSPEKLPSEMTSVSL